MASFAVSGGGARLGVVRPGAGGSARSGGERKSAVDLSSVLLTRKDAFSRAVLSCAVLSRTVVQVGSPVSLLAAAAGGPAKIEVVRGYGGQTRPSAAAVADGGGKRGVAVAHGARGRGAVGIPNETGDTLGRPGRRGSSDSEIERLRRTRAAAAAEPPPGMSAAPPRTVICVGDVHGHTTKLTSLWSNLQSSLPADAFAAALVIFLGDYSDRGPDARGVLDFLIALPARHPAQRHVFLCGNHDLAFAAFVGALPPPPDGSPFSATWGEYGVRSEEREGWFRGPGYEGMHVQGRRWGGVIGERWNAKKGLPYRGSIYDAQPTFESYGVAHGSPDLAKAVPEEHMRFLHDLVWIHEEENVPIDTDEGQIICNLIAVHAGLERTIDLNEQLRILRTRDTRVPKVPMLSGRQDVWKTPKLSLPLGFVRFGRIEAWNGPIQADCCGLFWIQTWAEIGVRFGLTWNQNRPGLVCILLSAARIHSGPPHVRNGDGRREARGCSSRYDSRTRATAGRREATSVWRR